MGVPGLWELLRPAAARTSLSTLAKEGFAANRRGLRAYTIGIDASLWIFHAQLPQHGENPFLRTIFFKLTTLLQQPILPVFVFDGPDKPRMKRGARVAGKFGTHDRRSIEFKRLLDQCGLVYWNAPGEAEAELALMNRQGKIDAVMSDDGDALLFGAKCLIRNNSVTLSGTKASQHVSATKGDLKTYEVFRSDAICAAWTADEGTSLRTEEDCRLAMVWIALLAGGDYVPEGIDTFGHKIAFGIAKAGMSSDLALYLSDKRAFLSALPPLQERMIHELRTNSTGQIGRKNPARAKSLAALEPSQVIDLDALDSYMRPKTSGDDPIRGWQGFTSSGRGGTGRNGGRGDIEGLARACERFFEWGTRDLVVKRFVSESVGTFGSDIVHSARSKVLQRDQAETLAAGVKDGRLQSYFPITAAATSSNKKSDSAAAVSRSPELSYPDYIVKIERTRPDPTNTDLTEYRVQYRTDGFVKRVQHAMEGSRVDPKNLSAEERAALGMKAIEQDEGDDEEPAKADKGLARLWIADWLVRDAWPDLVREWEEAEAAKSKPKAKTHSRTVSANSTTSKGLSRARKGLKADGEDVHGFTAFFSSQAGSQAGASARSFKRTTSAPTGSSTMRSFGTMATPTFGLAPIGEFSRLPTPSKTPSDEVGNTSNAVAGPSSRFTPRIFGRTISVPVNSLGSAARGGSKAVVDWSFKDEMFIDSDEEYDFAPLASPPSQCADSAMSNNRARETSSADSHPSARATSASRLERVISEERQRAAAVPPQAKSPPREVIDLCSSSEEEEPIEPKAPISRAARKSVVAGNPIMTSNVLRDSSRENSQPPTTLSHASKPKSKSKRHLSDRTSSRQATLAFPVTASSQTATPVQSIKQAARLAASPTPTKIKPKKGRKSYVVQEEDDELVVIDSTRGGVNLKGYGYNP